MTPELIKSIKQEQRETLEKLSESPNNLRQKQLVEAVRTVQKINDKWKH
jgi:hypothetical protein